jgi:MFS transporter, DHA1 family, multidrug resistance protein
MRIANLRIVKLDHNKAGLERVVIYFLVLTVSMYFIGLDFYAPALPKVQAVFQQPFHRIQWTITLFTLGFWSAQLVAGILVSHYNKKFILLWASAIFVLISWISAHTAHFHLLYLCRFIQGLACAVLYVLGFATTRELVSQERLSTIMPASSIGYTVMSAIAPAIGGYIVHRYEWSTTFIAMACAGGVLFLSAGVIYPSHQSKDTDVNFLRALAAYGSMMKDLHFVVSAFISISSVVAMTLFYQIASFVFVNEYQLTTVEFGLIAFGLIAMSIVARVMYIRLFRRYCATRGILTWSLVSLISACLAMLSVFLPSTLLLCGFIVCYTLFVFSLSVVHCYALVFGFSAASQSKSGYYSALYGFLTSSYIALGFTAHEK